MIQSKPMKPFLFLLACALLLAACQNPAPVAAHASASPVASDLPTQEVPAALPPTATPVFTQTATPLPPTETPRPSITPSPTPTARGALTWEQEQRLYEASLRFLAESEQQASNVVREQIDYLEGPGEHPSLVCGPLSAVILRDAGLLPPDTDLHGFFLLDPRNATSQQVLKTYFPEDRYQWYHFDTPTNEFDFNAFPLLPGDFIYLYAGRNGTFEHIITVSRVDAQGRPYTVSNLATEEGFVIRELMLYDPGQPGVGQFYDWTDFDLNKWLGLTGFGGFDLWRPIVPPTAYPAPPP